MIIGWVITTVNLPLFQDACCSLCYLATEVLDNNMSLLIEVSENNADNSEEAIEGLQLLLVNTLV